MLELILTTAGLITSEAKALDLQQPQLAFWGGLIRMLFSLGIILGLIFLINRFLLPRAVKHRAGNRVKILSKTYLDPQLTALLIGFETKRWLVLSHRNSLTVLHQFEESAEGPPLAN